MRKSKRGNILTENIIFIILNIIFISILILFLFSKMGDSAVLEEKYAKQIALIIDSAKPGMEIDLEMKDAIKKAKKDWGEDRIDDIVKIDKNFVAVKLREKGGYTYSFFNDVEVSAYPDQDYQSYIFLIDEKNVEEGK